MLAVTQSHRLSRVKSKSNRHPVQHPHRPAAPVREAGSRQIAHRSSVPWHAGGTEAAELAMGRGQASVRTGRRRAGLSAQPARVDGHAGGIGRGAARTGRTKWVSTGLQLDRRRKKLLIGRQKRAVKQLERSSQLDREPGFVAKAVRIVAPWSAALGEVSQLPGRPCANALAVRLLRYVSRRPLATGWPA